MPTASAPSVSALPGQPTAKNTAVRVESTCSVPDRWWTVITVGPGSSRSTGLGQHRRCPGGGRNRPSADRDVLVGAGDDAACRFEDGDLDAEVDQDRGQLATGVRAADHRHRLPAAR